MKKRHLERQKDGKLPCVCGKAYHARYDFHKIRNMIRKKEHPPPGDNPDIAFQRDLPPRPPSDPGEETDLASVSSLPTLRLPSIQVPLGPITEPPASSIRTTGPPQATRSTYAGTLVSQLDTTGQSFVDDDVPMSQYD